jgi:hypothetical protein
VRAGFLAIARFDSELSLERVNDGAKAFQIYATILTSLKLAQCRLKL